MPKTQANGIELYYETQGSGEPLVLIAGIGYGAWMWHKMVPQLADDYQVVTFDNRGAGESDKPVGGYTAQLLAADTAGLMDALEISKAHIMGHSMGGFVAQALALDYPEKVDKLILSATNFGGPRHIPITTEAMAVLTDMTGDPIERLRRGILVSCAPGFAEKQPQVVEEWVSYRVQHPLSLAGYQSQLGVGLSLIPESASFEKRLKDINAPTLILFGEYDRVVPPGNAELLENQIPDAAVKILPGAGHFFPFETPQTAVSVILEFLGRE
ncbi:MAG: alpha/beta hydrolase [Chloroflexi bacterium]|nr:MAG: alpha/beta hydrolase [Chloroflexota bacterium]